MTSGYRGIFVAFEGPDGSGKSSAVLGVEKLLLAEGVPHLLTSEPTKKSDAGLKARERSKSALVHDPRETQGLFVEDRRHHLEFEIEPALAEGKMVLSDRYRHSTVVYGTFEGIPTEELVQMNNSFRTPDLTIVIIASPETCIARLQNGRQTVERFEREEAVRFACHMYSTVIPKIYSEVVIIDGEQDADSVVREATSYVFSLLKGVHDVRG